MILRPLAASVVALALVAGCAASGTRHEDITLDKAPAKVVAAFNKDYPGATVKEVERETYKDGIVHYEFEGTHNGKKFKAEYNADGDKLDKH